MIICGPSLKDWAILCALYQRNHPGSSTTVEPPTTESSCILVARDGEFPHRTTIGFVRASYTESESGRHGVLHEVEVDPQADLLTIGDSDLQPSWTELVGYRLVEAVLSWLTYSCDCATADVSSLGDEGRPIIEDLGLQFRSPGVVTLARRPRTPYPWECPPGTGPQPVRVARQVFR